MTSEDGKTTYIIRLDIGNQDWYPEVTFTGRETLEHETNVGDVLDRAYSRGYFMVGHKIIPVSQVKGATWFVGGK